MPITHDSITEAFAPLSTDNHMAFFATSVWPEVVWQYGAPGATHPLAGRYEGMPAFVAGTFAKLGGCSAAPPKMTLTSALVDSSQSKAVVELRTVGTAKSGAAIDTTAVWIVKADEKGVFTEITSYVDSAFLVELLESDKEYLA